MKIVVFGPDKRTGALHDGNVVDLSYACAKYLRERDNEPSPLEMAEALVPSDLARLIEAGPRALEHAQKALDYLFDQAQDKIGPRGETLVYQAAEVRLHAPRPEQCPHRLRRRKLRRPRCGHGREDARQTLRGRCLSGDPQGRLLGVLEARARNRRPRRRARLPRALQSSRLRGRDRDRARQARRRPEALDSSGTTYGASRCSADWSIRAPRETSERAVQFRLSEEFRYVVLAWPLHRGGRGRSDQCRSGDIGQRRAPPALQHARHGLHLRRISRIPVPRLHALSRRHHQWRNGGRHRSGFERIIAGRQLRAGALSESPATWSR